MLQIVHDVAPRAKECFATADGGELNFANNIRALADKRARARANVVVDDVGYFAEPFFGDGVISDAVDDVAAQGVHYFSSAGNGSWQQAYQAPLRIVAPDRPGDRSNINLDGVDPNLYQGGFQDFDPGPGVDVAMDQALGFDGDDAGTGILDLQWDDPNDPNGAVVDPTPKVHVDGEITAAAPVASIPYDGTAGETIRGLVDAIPSGTTDYILTLKDPDGNILQQVDTGTSPETVFQTLPVTGTYTFEVSGFNGDLGDFTFDINTVMAKSRTSTDLNALFFDTDGNFLFPIADLNQFSGKPFEIAGFTGGGPLQMVISKGSTDPGTATQLRFQLEGDLQYDEYVQPFAPSVFGHPTARGRERRRRVRPVPADAARGLHLGRRRPADPVRLEGQPLPAARHPAQAGRGGDGRREHDVLRVGRGGGRRQPAELLRHERGRAARRGDRGARPPGARRAGVGLADADAVDPAGRARSRTTSTPQHSEASSGGLTITANGPQGDERRGNPTLETVGAMTDPQFFRVEYSGPGLDRVAHVRRRGRGPDRSRQAARWAVGGARVRPAAVPRIPALGGPDLFDQGFPFTVGGGEPGDQPRGDLRAVRATGRRAGQPPAVPGDDRAVPERRARRWPVRLVRRRP